MARPTTGFPDFATSDLNNPGPNVVEPDANKKASGWLFNEKPPREHFNWLHRVTALWTHYFDEEITAYLNLDLDSRLTAVENTLTPISNMSSGISEHACTLVSNDPASIPARFTLLGYNFFGMMYWQWPTVTMTLASGGPWSMWIEKATNWESYMLDRDRVGKYPIALIQPVNSTQHNCPGVISSLYNTDHLNTDGRMHLEITRYYGAENKLLTDSSFPEGVCGIQAGGFCHRSAT